jgi:hypothetical protein
VGPNDSKYVDVDVVEASLKKLVVGLVSVESVESVEPELDIRVDSVAVAAAVVAVGLVDDLEIKEFELAAMELGIV